MAASFAMNRLALVYLTEFYHFGSLICWLVSWWSFAEFGAGLFTCKLAVFKQFLWRFLDWARRDCLHFLIRLNLILVIIFNRASINRLPCFRLARKILFFLFSIFVKIEYLFNLSRNFCSQADWPMPLRYLNWGSKVDIRSFYLSSALYYSASSLRGLIVSHNQLRWRSWHFLLLFIKRVFGRCTRLSCNLEWLKLASF